MTHAADYLTSCLQLGQKLGSSHQQSIAQSQQQPCNARGHVKCLDVVISGGWKL